MGTVLKRRFLGPGAVFLAAFLSAFILYSIFFARPAYIERPADVLLPEDNSRFDRPLRPPALAPEKPAPSSAVDKFESPAGKGSGASQHLEVSKVDSSPLSTTSAVAATPSVSSSTETHKEWKFDAARDSRAYGLTTEQCESAFPGLFTEIERAVAYRKSVGQISPEDIDISSRDPGVVQAMILDQQLYILNEKIFNNEYDASRAQAILHALHRAIITSPEPLPNIEFSFSVADVVADPGETRRPIWALARKAAEEEIWLMSDFGYWSWPLDLVGEYEQIRREISVAEIDFDTKKKQAVWRGAVATNEHRTELVQVTANKEWADVKPISWAGVSELSPGEEVKAISMPEHCTYQFVIHTEGHSYSGRGKYLQNCNSVVIMHKRTWVEPHHALLVPEGPQQNFVEVEENFSDLEEKVVALLADPGRARNISLNSVNTFRDRYLTPAAQACYWRQLVKGWAEVGFEPAAWDESPEDKTKKKIRGVPFETFAIQGVVIPQPRKCKWLGKLLSQC